MSIKYELDPYNRLIAQRTRKATTIPTYRTILDGIFTIGPNNTLIYKITSPTDTTQPIPRQVKLQGDWSLDNGHNLVLTLTDTAYHTVNSLTLRGQLIDAHSDSLVFSIATRDHNNNRSVYLIELKGAWQADDNNRLTFAVKKERGTPDILTLEGAWELDDNNAIIYTYTQRTGKRTDEAIQSIGFRGTWRIAGDKRLAYDIEGSTGSSFAFTTKYTAYDRAAIKYDIGITLAAERKPIARRVTFFGSWRLNQKLGLIFELRAPNTQAQQFTFGAQARAANTTAVTFKLLIAPNTPAGAELTLTRAMLQDSADLFLKLLSAARDKSITLGFALRW